MKQSYIAVKDFERFQHYKGRTPPWIKLYNALLDDYRFVQLSDAARGQLMLIWLVASRHNNRIPNDREYIARAIHTKSKLQLDALIAAGWLSVTDDAPLAERKQDASKPLATCPRSAIPEVETEKEVEVETEKEHSLPAREEIKKPNGWPEPITVFLSRRENPGPWAAALVAMQKGLGTPGGKAVTVEHLAQACLEIEQLGGEITPRRFRRVLEQVVEPKYKGAGGDDAEFVKAANRLQEIVSYRDPVRSQSLTAEGWQVITPQERAAIKAIGTIERVLTAKPDQWPFVVRDFLKATRGAAA